MTVKNALILHGTDGSPESNWFMWLKEQLENDGYKIWLPQLPNSKEPDPVEYNKLLLNNPEFQFNEQTIIIGHSSGAVAALHLLQNLPLNTQIEKCYLVSAFIDNLGWDSLDKLFVEPIDFNRLKNNCDKFVIIHSDNDPYCPLEHAQKLVKELDGELVVIPGQGHFNTEFGPQYSKFPELLNLVRAEN